MTSSKGWYFKFSHEVSLLCIFFTLELSLYFYYFLFSEAASSKYDIFYFKSQEDVSNYASPSEFSNNAVVFSFPWCSVLSNEASEFITYALAIASWDRVCQIGPWEIKTHSPCVSWGCADELRHICIHQGPAQNSMCQNTLGREPFINSSKSYPDQRHKSIVLATLRTMGLLAE